VRRNRDASEGCCAGCASWGAGRQCELARNRFALGFARILAGAGGVALAAHLIEAFLEFGRGRAAPTPGMLRESAPQVESQMRCPPHSYGRPRSGSGNEIIECHAHISDSGSRSAISAHILLRAGFLTSAANLGASIFKMRAVHPKPCNNRSKTGRNSHSALPPVAAHRLTRSQVKRLASEQRER
jgi:hypothetical protein